MKVIHYSDIPPISMVHPSVKNVAGRVMIGKEDGAANFCMRRFEIGADGFTPKHSHDWEHEVWVLEGQGEVFIEDQWHALKGGTAVFVPPNVEHQFRNTGDATFAFLCLVPSQAPEI
ncbi:MAG TPA: cupin domain-containing protein [Desulfobacteraceae bacterium]|nr:cupin domain-containing protein [Desulfobacteraceae bacterium]|tara:strand:+ start:386 stop:736 length:351 start_codon:yes stop_codon:yes gene_type:complete